MVTEATSRSTFASSWGTILSTAGVAIGLGNIWRFPYMMGQHGGALFLVAYLLIAIAFG
ncbi:MAG: sodium-dependent transporter, partial [Planctomycetes bacterium]|nr:sodium-dependent transporter [Planctomycetota bacterium]